MDFKDWVRVCFAGVLLTGSAFFRLCTVPVPGLPAGAVLEDCLFLTLDPLPLPRMDCPAPELLVRGDAGSKAFCIEYFKPLPWGLDLNRASEPLLTLIHGIGPAKAAAAVRDRERNGRFADVTDFCRRCRLNPEALFMDTQWVYAGE